MATKQGYLKEKGSQDKLAPKTLDSLVKDSARNRALSASLQELAERQCLGYPPFATTQNYTVGDKVFYDRKLWKFTSSHAAGAWNASHVTAWSVEDEVSELKVAITALDERKANIDGFYEGMGVGVAKRLEGNTDVAGSFLERTTGGDAELANGLAQLNEVQGGSVKFNQLVKNGNFSDTSKTLTVRCSLSVNNNVGTITPESNPSDYMLLSLEGNALIKGHKYLVVASVKLSEETNKEVSIRSTNASRILYTFDGTKTNWQTCKFLYDTTTDATISDTYVFRLLINQNISFPIDIKNVITIDLTAIFGAGNEPSTVAEFEAWLAENVGLKEYYEYTDGEVVNNNMTGIESTGFNLFNPTTGKARIIGAYSEVYGNYYGIVGTHGALTFEDDLGNVSTITPDSDGKFELDVSGYLSVADAGNDVAVFLWWDGKKTEYEDYDVEIAHLDVRHIYGKKNGAGELVQVWPTGMPRINDIVDKLCIENGAVVAKRPIGEVDLGDLAWYLSSGTTDVFRVSVTGRKGGSEYLLCARYSNIGFVSNVNNMESGQIGSHGTQDAIFVKDSAYNDAAAFKTAMNGVLLYFELATTETYTDLVYMGSEYFADGTPVALPVNYKVDNWGVESILPKNTGTILTAKPTIKVRYAIDAVEQLDTHSDEIDSLHDDIDELDATKANTVGVYDDMVVGAAKAIAGNQRLDKVFTSMVVDGADGVAKINEVRGKSLVWNQLVQNGNFTSDNNWHIERGTKSISDNVASLIATSQYGDIYQDINLVSGHKYLLSAYFKPTSASTNARLSIGGSGYSGGEGVSILLSDISDTTKFTKVSTIGTWTKNPSSTNIRIQFMDLRSSDWDTIQIKDIMCIDLTQMFGAGNEPVTVAEFEAMFPDAYYEYNDGEIINNATEKLDVTGFNQWDEEWELCTYNVNTGSKSASTNRLGSKNKIPIFPSTTYYIQYPSNINQFFVFFYDINRNYINVYDNVANIYGTFNTPAKAAYMTFYIGGVDMTTYNHDICINISDPSRNGTYEPYKHGTVPLNLSTITGKHVGVEGAESVVIFPDGMRQAGSVADTLLVDDDGYARRAVVKVGSRAYQSGDESDSTVVTDLTNTLYALETASEYILDEPILMTFKAYHGGTIVQSPQAPDSAPMSMNVTFALDAVGTLNNLPQNYISADSMDAFLAQLGTAMNGTWTKSWDAANSKYTFSFQSSQTE